MKGKLFTSWSLGWLLAAILLVAGGSLNMLQRGFQKLPPTDGVLWVQRADGIYAEKVLKGFAGDRAGISVGDRLIGIGIGTDTTDEITAPSDVQMYLDSAGVDGSLTYFYQKTSYSFTDNYYFADLRHIDPVPRWTPSIIFLSLVGVIWLAVGIFVLFKQGGHSPFVIHFAAICLAAFVFHVYKPLGIGQDFDLAVSLIDDLAFALFVPLFVHFCMRYPVRSTIFDRKRWKTVALYVPAAVIWLSIAGLVLIPQISTGSGAAEAIARFDNTYNALGILYTALLYHFVAGISVGAAFLIWRFFKNRQAIVRQRLKWAMWGTVAALVPVVLFQTAKLAGIDIPNDSWSAALTTLPLALIPLSFGHSVVRYRLMDVDIVVRRALVYALTTLAIAMMIGAVALGLVFIVVGKDLSSTEITLRALIAVIAMAAIVLISEPLKKFLQERADRFFYGERYDLRQGLLDFGKTLSATTALDPLMNALIERLRQVLDVEKVAIFVEDEHEREHYRLAKAEGLDETYRIPADFRTMIRLKARGKGIVRADEIDSADDPAAGNGSQVRQELHYFVPCLARGKMVAVIGLGRASDGSLLSSEDLEILRTVSGYVAVAIENSRLYQEQQQHTEQLAVLKEFNESIVESVNVGLLAVDEEGRVTSCNSPFEVITGRLREDIVGRLVEEIFDENFALSLDAILGKGRWHLTEIRNAYKLHTVNASGNPLILNVAVAPLRSTGNQHTGAIIVLEDVSARVKLEETLQQSEKLSSIGLLAAGVAHEVNTPLTGVSSYTQMLIGMIPETDPKHALLQKMQRQTDRASNIVGNLLNFSRTGNSTDFEELDLNKLLNDTLQLLEPQLRKSNVSIVKEYAEGLPAVSGNAGKLQQVFTNLVMNARDAMFSGGTITLRTRLAENDVLQVHVIDTGEGIPAENLTKIFDPFFTTKGVGNGTGLGLAVTYGIVQEHGGSIEAQSDGTSGTTFILTFPVSMLSRRRAVS
ncbi:MAG: PAS domain S-box protein [Chloracidobacterium sp.]|nr:PAS domain S-box protein [Chloracidobacterium sp.]MCO5333418.1 ATP-binding protein [Pyrinomonadaceae bacterium]